MPAAATGVTVFASVRDAMAAICIGRAIGRFPIRTLTLGVGDRRPLGVGSLAPPVAQIRQGGN